MGVGGSIFGSLDGMEAYPASVNCIFIFLAKENTNQHSDIVKFHM